jgi:hypothetical protein
MEKIVKSKYTHQNSVKGTAKGLGPPISEAALLKAGLPKKKDD